MHPLKSNGTLAQLVEQRTENPCVPGSIPGGTTFYNYKTLLNNCLQGFFFFKFEKELNQVIKLWDFSITQKTASNSKQEKNYVSNILKYGL